MKDFAAIDFETANECSSSVCSVGLVVVRAGEIVDRYYSLIRPEPEYHSYFCDRVHEGGDGCGESISLGLGRGLSPDWQTASCGT